MKNFLTLALVVMTISNLNAETQSSFIERTSSVLKFEDRINIAITNVHRAYNAFGEDGFSYGYACQDIGKAQLAIDLALHNKMDITKQIDLNSLYKDLDSLQDKICIRNP